MASKKNIPGIIPVAGLTSEFGMEWDASLVPISPNYTALEASVYECLNVGCSSIWIVATDWEIERQTWRAFTEDVTSRDRLIIT